jgi:chromosome segregation ATPase
MKRSIETFVVLILSGMLLISLVSDASAQTRKKKRTVRRTPTTRVQQQPLYTSEPIIVSRASDFDKENTDQDGSDVTLTPLTQQTEPTERDKQLADISDRIKSLERGLKNGYDEKQKRLLLNLDILTRAEQRSESLRKQRFEMIEKASSIQTKLDQIEADIRPEMIERAVAQTGSLRPEELRDARRKNLEAERQNLKTLLTDVQNTLASLDQSVQRADDLVERLRTKLEKDIDSALSDDKPNN